MASAVEGPIVVKWPGFSRRSMYPRAESALTARRGGTGNAEAKVPGRRRLLMGPLLLTRCQSQTYLEAPC
jgi:hypothetical protein